MFTGDGKKGWNLFTQIICVYFSVYIELLLSNAYLNRFIFRTTKDGGSFDTGNFNATIVRKHKINFTSRIIRRMRFWISKNTFRRPLILLILISYVYKFETHWYVYLSTRIYAYITAGTKYKHKFDIRNNLNICCLYIFSRIYIPRKGNCLVIPSGFGYIVEVENQRRYSIYATREPVEMAWQRCYLGGVTVNGFCWTLITSYTQSNSYRLILELKNIKNKTFFVLLAKGKIQIRISIN